jgi:hypothetical protein
VERDRVVSGRILTLEIAILAVWSYYIGFIQISICSVIKRQFSTRDTEIKKQLRETKVWFRGFCRIQGLLPCSQHPAAGPNPKKKKSSPHASVMFLWIHFNIVTIFVLIFQAGFFQCVSHQSTLSLSLQWRPHVTPILSSQ